MAEQKVKVHVTRNVLHLPCIALRGLVVFPNNIVHFEVGRSKSIAAIEAAMPVQMVATSLDTYCIVSYIPSPAYTEPPGELIYMLMSLPGSAESR